VVFFMPMISMLVGILAAFFVYNDAKSRGHGPITALLWAAGSTIAPIVVIPLYFLFGRKAKSPDKSYDNDIIDIEATVVEETINCPTCGREINGELVTCPYCQQPADLDKKDH
jgi:hypothetical protein